MAEEKDRILIVEDSEITLYKVKAVLIRLGFDVTAFSDPVEAVKWLVSIEKKPDLIISDVSMPGMDGYEFIRQVRGQEETKKTPIILLTSHVDTRDKIEGLEAGADDYLGKTVSLTELELRVKALLARKHSDDTPISKISARSIAVFSLRGGVGVSTLAVNLSLAISQLWGIETYLWDMSMGVGQCALMMNLKPVSSIATIADWTESSLDDNTLRSMLLKHESGVVLMPAPTSVEELDLITIKAVDLIWTGLVSMAPYVIIDAGSHFSEQTLTVLERADIILLVLAPELASINAAYQALKVFADIGFPSGKIQPVLNHTNHVHSFTKEKIGESLKRSILAEIPFDDINMIKAINQGTPYISIAPKSDTTLAISKMAYRISSSEMESKIKENSGPMLDWVKKSSTG